MFAVERRNIMINLICIITKYPTSLGHIELARMATHPGVWAACTPAINIPPKKAHNYSFYCLPTESLGINIVKKVQNISGVMA